MAILWKLHNLVYTTYTYHTDLQQYNTLLSYKLAYCLLDMIKPIGSIDGTR